MIYSEVWAYGILAWEIFNDAQEPYKGWNCVEVKNQVKIIQTNQQSKNSTKCFLPNSVINEF